MLTANTLFRALADETRLRCLVLLARHDALCVCELTHALDVSQPKMSRHLATLRDSGLVADRRQGLWVFYGLHPELPGWARAVLDETAAGLRGREPFATDARRTTLQVNQAERCGPAAGEARPARVAAASPPVTPLPLTAREPR